MRAANSLTFLARVIATRKATFLEMPNNTWRRANSRALSASTSDRDHCRTWGEAGNTFSSPVRKHWVSLWEIREKPSIPLRYAKMATRWVLTDDMANPSCASENRYSRMKGKGQTNIDTPLDKAKGLQNESTSWNRNTLWMSFGPEPRYHVLQKTEVVLRINSSCCEVHVCHIVVQNWTPY